jgi:hypothetical protein
MIIHTTAEGVSLARKLETDSAAFYEQNGQVYPQFSEALATFTRENKKNMVQIEQTYYSMITDAIEGCFALDLETDTYNLDIQIMTVPDVEAFVRQAIRMEEKIRQFYLTAGEQSKSLMTDLARSYNLTAKKRKARIEQLSGFLTA